MKQFKFEVIDYKAKINEIYDNLPEELQGDFAKIWLDCRAQGKTDEWFWLALELLGDRNIFSNSWLFKNNKFCNEVDENLKINDIFRKQAARKIIEADKSNYNYQRAIYPATVSKEYKISARAMYDIKNLYGDKEIP